MTTEDPGSLVHPFTVRLSVDVDPAGNPIGMHATQFVRGKEAATLWFEVPAPFDSPTDAWQHLLDRFFAVIGSLRTLF